MRLGARSWRFRFASLALEQGARFERRPHSEGLAARRWRFRSVSSTLVSGMALGAAWGLIPCPYCGTLKKCACTVAFCLGPVRSQAGLRTHAQHTPPSPPNARPWATQSGIASSIGNLTLWSTSIKCKEQRQRARWVWALAGTRRRGPFRPSWFLASAASWTGANNNSRAFVAGEIGRRRQAQVSRLKCRGVLAGSVDWR